MRQFIFSVLAATTVLAKPLTPTHPKAPTAPPRDSYPKSTVNKLVTPTSTSIPPGESNSACAAVSTASSSFLSAHPSANAVAVNASIAYHCLNSIPSVPEDALQLLRSLRAYLELQSDKEYLKNPPTGYVNPSYDLDAALTAIESNIEANVYKSEIAFQLDIYYALQQAYDGHLSWQGDILKGVFSFFLDSFTGLVSVSVDGLSDPEVYFAGDLLNITSNTVTSRDDDFTPSSVTKINGIPVTDAVESLGLTINSQDPDARYNRQFFSLGGIGSDGVLGLFLGFPVPTGQDHFEFEFANGTITRVVIMTQVLQDFTNITNGQAAYERFAPFANLYSNTSESVVSSAASTTVSTTATATATASASASASVSTTATSTILPNIPYFPYPVMKDDLNLIAGYYLNDTGYDDVAVLQMTGFQPSSASPPDDWTAQFASTLSYFLSNATTDGKKKLIIDLQGNGGGSIDLGTDTFAQLFPNIAPNLKSNIRRSAGMDIIISSASSSVAALASNVTEMDQTAFEGHPFTYQDNITPDLKAFDSVDEFLNGITLNNTSFTAFFQTNYTNPLVSEANGFEIDPTNPSISPPFAPENIIVLTDGTCASTCTTLSEHLKNQAGVQFIVVGGRPRHGPVQAIGGIKGTQVFEFLNINTMIETFNNGTPAQLAAIADTEWAYFNKLPMARTAAAAKVFDVSAGAGAVGGVNGRNAFRIGDESNTPLQFVYEAADCRIWFTREMLYDPVFLWNRVAEVAFLKRTGLRYDSEYCVAGSTGHGSSISGGWKTGTLGPQGQGEVERGSAVFGSAPWVSGGGRGIWEGW